MPVFEVRLEDPHHGLSFTPCNGATWIVMLISDKYVAIFTWGFCCRWKNGEGWEKLFPNHRESQGCGVHLPAWAASSGSLGEHKPLTVPPHDVPFLGFLRAAPCLVKLQSRVGSRWAGACSCGLPAGAPRSVHCPQPQPRFPTKCDAGTVHSPQWLRAGFASRGELKKRVSHFFSYQAVSGFRESLWTDTWIQQVDCSF